MRFSKSLIVFYVFSLAVWPCKDRALQSDVSRFNTIQKLDNMADETNSDQCSAFCLCNCCGHQFIPLAKINVMLLAESSRLFRQDSYTLNPLFTFSHWQPPKS